MLTYCLGSHILFKQVNCCNLFCPDLPNQNDYEVEHFKNENPFIKWQLVNKIKQHVSKDQHIQPFLPPKHEIISFGENLTCSSTKDRIVEAISDDELSCIKMLEGIMIGYRTIICSTRQYKIFLTII